MIAHHRHRHSHQLLSLHSQSSSTAAAASDLHSAAADKQEDVLYHLGITSNDPVIEDFKDARSVQATQHKHKLADPYTLVYALFYQTTDHGWLSLSSSLACGSRRQCGWS